MKNASKYTTALIAMGATTIRCTGGQTTTPETQQEKTAGQSAGRYFMRPYLIGLLATAA